jgi:deoxyribodipyrimidine photo-lyase
MSRVLWFRRDLRLHDNPALVAAVEGAFADGDGTVVPLITIDSAQWRYFSPPLRAYIRASMEDLDRSLGGNLLIQHGDPAQILPRVARAVAASTVHVAAAHTPYAMARDKRVSHALEQAGIRWEVTGSGYAVAPGRVTKEDGTAYRVYTPFYKGWLRHGWRTPCADPATWPTWAMPVECDGYPEAPGVDGMVMPVAGEAAAVNRWHHFRDTHLDGYNDNRNRPDLDATSRLSIPLMLGEIHPRTLLAELGDTPGHETFRKELAWREFYADVLYQRPDTVSKYYNTAFADMDYDNGAQADQRFTAWCEGRTGYPFVDAGMRQLRAEGWMHNRVRMVVASFLVKDLHLEWQRGAAHFERWLLDFDSASNSHGWQWTAGCGTDASPYYRVFNPVGQGEKFDPEGDYVRRYVPELRHLQGASVHQPWEAPDGMAHGYPQRLVDHAVERTVALERLAALKDKA